MEKFIRLVIFMLLFIGLLSTFLCGLACFALGYWAQTLNVLLSAALIIVSAVCFTIFVWIIHKFQLLFD